jgi:hypothetical protein
MASELTLFVSKRLQRAAVAILCLIALQATISLSSCHPELAPQPMVRVAVGS